MIIKLLLERLIHSKKIFPESEKLISVKKRPNYHIA